MLLENGWSHSCCGGNHVQWSPQTSRVLIPWFSPGPQGCSNPWQMIATREVNWSVYVFSDFSLVSWHVGSNPVSLAQGQWFYFLFSIVRVELLIKATDWGGKFGQWTWPVMNKHGSGTWLYSMCKSSTNLAQFLWLPRCAMWALGGFQIWKDMGGIFRQVSMVSQ